MAVDNEQTEGVEPAGELSSDGEDGRPSIDVEDSRSPIQSIRAGQVQKDSKCAYCRKDHKKCVRTSANERCERCKNLKYRCFGGLETALASSPKRVLNRNKCDYCRVAKQKCLPVDRVFPDICERCREKNLPCTEPGSPRRKRPRFEKSPSTNASIMETEAHRFSQIVQPLATNQATPPETPQPFPPDWGTHQTQSNVDQSNLQNTTRGDSNGSKLAMLSRAAVIHQTHKVFSPTSYGRKKGLTKYQSVMARDRWIQAYLKIRRAIRLRNIASILLFAPQPDGIVLCNVCTNLGISRDNFVVNAKDQYTGVKRHPLNPLDGLWSAAKQAETGRGLPLGEIRLGNLETIRKRGHICSFCRLVWNSAKYQVQNSGKEEVDSIIASATWQIDGRYLEPRGSGKHPFTEPQNRCIRLHWSKEGSQVYFKSGMVLNDAFITVVADIKEPWDNNFLGRPIDISQNPTTIAKGWMEKCQNHRHSRELLFEDEYSWREAIGPDFRLIDVLQMCTVSPQQDAPQYVALSYSWAETENFYFHDGEVEEFRRLGESRELERIWPRLPRTVQDAITLAKALGFRYLWVDVLCTIYKYSAGLNHRAMAKIFSNAFLTVCAADGQGPDAGLVALHTPRNPVAQYIERCAPGLDLMVYHPLETHMSQSRWYRRGWIFQEHVLSKRCLIFAAGRAHWECRDATSSENIVEHSRKPGWTIDMLHNPLNIIGDLSSRAKAFRAYMRCVEAYTLREFSFPEDVLRGFESVGTLIETSLKTDLFYGLPSSVLDLALLWEFKMAPSVNQRRQSSDASKFPTWSWCGWEGAVVYRSSTLSGTLSDVPEWISKRTWISWYVRDRYNITRLLHKLDQEPTTVQTPQSTIKFAPGNWTFKLEDKRIQEQAWGVQTPTQSYQQQHVKWPERNRSMFQKSLPNFQSVTMDVDNGISEDPKSLDTKYLQFWTWSGFFCLKHQPLSNSQNLGPGLSRFGILDNKDDFCGTIVLPDEWVFGENAIDAVYEVIAISEARGFTQDEFDGWTYYIPKEQDESEWDLWYVLLVQKVDDVVVKRMGVGKMFQAGFENSYLPGKGWREFIMA